MRFDAASLLSLAALAALALVGKALARRGPPFAVLGRPGVLIGIAAAWTAALWVFEARTDPLPLAFALAHALASRSRPSERGIPAARALESPAAAWALAAATGAISLWVWGGLRPIPVIQDETAYVLQARLFASGRWTDPPPPRPEFFEQAHVLVVPRRAAKYPPGHALALAPAAAVGVPALAPILLASASGGLLFVLARRVAGANAAVLTWLVWLASPLGLRYRSSFFSEVTTGFLWLVAWAAADRWRRGGRPVWLLACAAAVGLGAITRPLTMLLFALPLAAVVLMETVRRRAWPALAGAAGVGLLVLLALPLWSAKTTGDWRTSPLTLYTRQYLPFDVPGFGLRGEEPSRALPEDLRRLSASFANVHRTHLPARIPATLLDRATEFVRDGFGSGLILLLPVAMVGLFVLPREGLFAGATGGLLLAGYLLYAHHAHWSVYYLEALAPLALAAGAGLSAVLAGLPEGWRRPGMALAPAALLFVLGTAAVREREIKRGQEAPFRLFQERVATLGKGRAIVFVRYGAGHNPALSLIRNGPAIADAPVWVAYDDGAENTQLREVDPSRAAYLFDEETGELVPLDAASPSR